jgi:hypothetical protein
LSADILLGMDFMQNYKVCLNFDDKTLTIPGARPVKLLVRAMLGDYQIAVNQTIVLPLMSQTVVPDKGPDCMPVDHEGLFEPLPDLCNKHDVLGGRVYVRPLPYSLPGA